MKTCSDCRRALEPSEFYSNKAWGDYLDNLCKECRHAHNRRYRAKLGPEGRKRLQQKQMLAHYRRKFGLSPGDVAMLREAAGDACMVCGASDKLHIDHDHETDEVRGLLCHACNHALGHGRDDPERLRALADYLEDPPARRLPFSGTGFDQLQIPG